MGGTDAVAAVLDIGSNTIRLLVGRVSGDRVERLLDHSAFVRLGLGVDATGELRPDRQEAAMEAVRDLTAAARKLGARSTTAIATSAVRDARNGRAFAQRLEQETGIPVEILSGEREAALTYRGATMGLEIEDGAIVCDLGGGSAELIHADGSHLRWARSLPLGSGRLAERFLEGDPPRETGLTALRSHVRQALAELPDATPVIGIFTGGTAAHLSVVAGAGGDVSALDLPQLEAAVRQLTTHTAAEIVGTYGFDPERVRILPAGATAIEEIARFYGVDHLIITRSGIREGALLEAANARD